MKIEIEIKKDEIIEAGCKVRHRWSNENDVRTVKRDGDHLVIRYRLLGNTWSEHRYDVNSPADMRKLHTMYRRINISPAVEFLQCFMSSKNTKTDSAERVRSAALQVAIDANMEFWIDDMGKLLWYSPWYNDEVRLGSWGWDPEALYSHILNTSRKGDMNRSALRSLEKALDRKPFISTGLYGGERLYVGSQFLWEGMSVTVTSIKRERDPESAAVDGYSDRYIVACGRTYNHETYGWKVERRFKITHEMLAGEAALGRGTS